MFAFQFFCERKAHPPLGARAEVQYKVEVEDARNHRNRKATSGWMMPLVLLLFFQRARLSRWIGELRQPSLPLYRAM